MKIPILYAGEKVLNLPFEELATLEIDWTGGYLPLVHPVSLRVITIVQRDCPRQPDAWVAADVHQGKLIHIGHHNAKDVAVFTRTLYSLSEVVGIEGRKERDD